VYQENQVTVFPLFPIDKQRPEDHPPNPTAATPVPEPGYQEGLLAYELRPTPQKFTIHFVQMQGRWGHLPAFGKPLTTAKLSDADWTLIDCTTLKFLHLLCQQQDSGEPQWHTTGWCYTL